MKVEDSCREVLFCIATAIIFAVLAYFASSGVNVILADTRSDYFLLGLLLSVHGGGIFTFLLNLMLEKYEPGLKKENQEKKDKKKKQPNVPSCLTGFIERFIFTAIIGIAGTASLPYVGGLMGGWLGLKLAANWQQRHDDFARARGILALINGLVSLFFALVGGLITNLK
ncbi:MAG: hypothetical protein WD823_06245 [Sulfuricaulis sp.]|uniref:hypothetical protein n=1 Tax=Sulfuricaulis sp. TaxID=2003553 RepID=UPI0034A1B786